MGRASPVRASVLRRSEEHTSELQSRQYLVCRLLLEKTHQHHGISRQLPAARAPRALRPSPRISRAALDLRRGRVQRLLFFFNDTATTEIYTLSLHDALPI